MMKSLICLVAAVCSVFVSPSVARACDTLATATLESDCVVMDRAGRKGVWFSLDTADKLRKLKLEVPELRLQILNYEKTLEIKNFQISSYLETIALKDSVIQTSKASMDTFARQARLAQEGERLALNELHAWYRSPALWAAVGATVVTGIVITLTLETP